MRGAYFCGGRSALSKFAMTQTLLSFSVTKITLFWLPLGSIGEVDPEN